jgi:ABC-type branched-subunit amino acid transport system permease subunit
MGTFAAQGQAWRKLCQTALICGLVILCLGILSVRVSVARFYHSTLVAGETLRFCFFARASPFRCYGPRDLTQRGTITIEYYFIQ